MIPRHILDIRILLGVGRLYEAIRDRRDSYSQRGQSLKLSNQVTLPEFKDAPVVRRLKLRRTVVDVNHGKARRRRRKSKDLPT